MFNCVYHNFALLVSAEEIGIRFVICCVDYFVILKGVCSDNKKAGWQLICHSAQIMLMMNPA
ncbi:hypothetical protein CYJ59_00100 [Gardnerella leopoldii]|uniref:Uncharacterized protein n=2 Tax=Gardnerella TaxID=2701 RepID=A0AAP8IRP8_GARVA|nr:hypothetical protein CYJ60_00100 [Gardnerella vaginalis]PKZ18899.1 hypothetical protein CYJ59_00100 [Gardnerella vaginalis]PKZ59382.1 hypothetical protein CYJ61_03520 [Gardnerella vaginalis]